MSNEQKNILAGLDTIFFKVLLNDILSEAGHAVCFVAEGAKVIETVKADAKSIDLLMLDMHAPNVNGFDVLRWINENGCREAFPVIVITGVAEPTPVVEKLKSFGVSGLISRSLTPEQIILRINNILFSDKAAAGVPRLRVPVSIGTAFMFDGSGRTGAILNISESGAYLYADVKMPKDAQVGLRFVLPGSEKLIHARGVVKWSPIESKSGGRGHGIMFTWVSPSDLEALKAFIVKEKVKYDSFMTS